MDNETRKKLGKKIREKRENLDLSQSELAISVNKESPAYIAFIEAGERNVSAMDLMLIAKQLGTTVSELLGESESKKHEFVQVLRSSSDISAQDKKKIEEYYNFLQNRNKNIHGK